MDLPFTLAQCAEKATRAEAKGHENSQTCLCQPFTPCVFQGRAVATGHLGGNLGHGTK